MVKPLTRKLIHKDGHIDGTMQPSRDVCWWCRPALTHHQKGCSQILISNKSSVCNCCHLKTKNQRIGCKDSTKLISFYSCFGALFWTQTWVVFISPLCCSLLQGRLMNILQTTLQTDYRGAAGPMALVGTDGSSWKSCTTWATCVGCSCRLTVPLGTRALEKMLHKSGISSEGWGDRNGPWPWQPPKTAGENESPPLQPHNWTSWYLTSVLSDSIILCLLCFPFFWADCSSSKSIMAGLFRNSTLSFQLFCQYVSMIFNVMTIARYHHNY